MRVGIKLKIIRVISRFLIRINKDFFTSSFLSPFSYKVADFLVAHTFSENDLMEVEGFKMKKGKTTRLLVLTGMPHEPGVTNLIKHIVSTDMIVIDAGANIGWFTLILSKLVGDKGHVYSFEPDPQLFKILKENTEINNLTNVSLFQMALSDKNGVAKFSINKIQDGDNRLDSQSMTENTIDVKTIKLDRFSEENNLKIDFIKMDIQGSEPKVFAGMKKVVSKNPQLKIITEFSPKTIIDVGSNPEDFLIDLEKSNFIIKEIVEKKGYQLKPIRKENIPQTNLRELNLYCYKK